MRDEELPGDRRVFGGGSLEERDLDDILSRVVFSGIEKENGVAGLGETRSKRSTAWA